MRSSTTRWDLIPRQEQTSQALSLSIASFLLSATCIVCQHFVSSTDRHVVTHQAGTTLTACVIREHTIAGEAPAAKRELATMSMLTKFVMH